VCTVCGGFAFTGLRVGDLVCAGCWVWALAIERAAIPMLPPTTVGWPA
jgi:hypothetical protein